MSSDVIGAGLIDACCMAAAIRYIVNRFHCLSSTVMGVLLTPTGARRARVETGGADRAEPDRPQGLDRAELRSRAVNFPTHHPNSRARESSADMGTCIVRTIWFESQSGSHWCRGDSRTAASYHGRGHGSTRVHRAVSADGRSAHSNSGISPLGALRRFCTFPRECFCPLSFLFNNN